MCPFFPPGYTPSNVPNYLRMQRTGMNPFCGPFSPAVPLVWISSSWDLGKTAIRLPSSLLLQRSKEQQRWISEVHAAEQNIYRVTMTAPIINQARAAVFIVSSASKAQVLKEVLEGPRDPMRLPAELIRPELHGGELYWLVDKPAASLLAGDVEEKSGR